MHSTHRSAECTCRNQLPPGTTTADISRRSGSPKRNMERSFDLLRFLRIHDMRMQAGLQGLPAGTTWPVPYDLSVIAPGRPSTATPPHSPATNSAAAGSSAARPGSAHALGARSSAAGGGPFSNADAATPLQRPNSAAGGAASRPHSARFGGADSASGEVVQRPSLQPYKCYSSALTRAGYRPCSPASPSAGRASSAVSHAYVAGGASRPLPVLASAARSAINTHATQAGTASTSTTASDR